MAESIDKILEKLRTQLDGSAANLGSTGDDNNAKESVGATMLSSDQITSAVYVISPSQISYISELFANSMTNALNMRAMAPRIRQIAEQSLRTALGAAKKQGAN
ncbi:MAG: hypothetical protein FWG80_02005 [Alphaproteobacteria bacterium]|nr:hypothetical protein [Alphaproteobacteria bacterium]